MNEYVTEYAKTHKVLTLQIDKECFNTIRTGTQKVEHRYIYPSNQSLYITDELVGANTRKALNVRQYDALYLINGRRQNAPRMLVEVEWSEFVWVYDEYGNEYGEQRGKRYHLCQIWYHLGNVLDVEMPTADDSQSKPVAEKKVTKPVAVKKATKPVANKESVVSDKKEVSTAGIKPVKTSISKEEMEVLTKRIYVFQYKVLNLDYEELYNDGVPLHLTEEELLQIAARGNVIMYESRFGELSKKLPESVFERIHDGIVRRYKELYPDDEDCLDEEFDLNVELHIDSQECVDDEDYQPDEDYIISYDGIPAELELAISKITGESFKWGSEGPWGEHIDGV